MKLFYPLALSFALLMANGNLFSQCSASQSQLTLSIDFTLDNYPNEDGWKLINLTTGNPVDSACFGSYSSGGQITETLCVNPSDQYSLLVLDDYGDGLDGAVYHLSYAYGNSIDSVYNTNLSIPYTHCGAIYNTNTIVDSINFTAGFVPPPPCQAPSDLEANSWTTNSASLAWIENDTAVQWQMEYGLHGFNTGNGTSMIVNSNPTIISSLAVATEYDFYVRSICSPGDTSAWAGPEYFKSACGSISNYPYVESFDDTIASCWRKAIDTGQTNWELATGTASDISAPFDGSGFMEKDYANSVALLVSPPFDLSALTTSGQVKLFLHRHDLADPTDNYVVFVNDTPKIAGADTLLQIFSKTTIAPSVPAKGWYEYLADIPSAYQNQTVYIIIQGSTRKSIFSYDLGVDLFSLKEIPSCAAPNMLSTSNHTDSSASLFWLENGIAGSWEIEYGIYGFTQGSGAIMTTSSNPFVLNNLSANTDYEFYVRSVCGIGDSSAWAGPFLFSTLCNTVTSIPFVENFDGSLNMDGEWDCWKIVNVDGGDTWRQGNQFLSNLHSAPYAALGMGNNNDHLISPRISLPNKPIALTLWDKVEHSTFNNIYEILVSTTNDSLQNFSDTLATINAFDTAWTKRTVYLSAYAGQKVYVSIHQKYSAADFYGFGIDDFMIDTVSSCADPSHLGLTRLLDSSAVLGWTENGTAVQWQIQYGNKGFILGTGNYKWSNSTSVNLDSLQSNTSYDFYVRSVCGPVDSSNWAGPFTFKTLCLPTAAPYSQDFENNAAIPNCWRQGIENMENWLFEDTVAGINHVGNLGKFNGTSVSGKHFAYVDDSSPHGTTTTLYSPLVDLKNAGGPMLSFFRLSNNENQSNVDFYVDVWDGTNWNNVFFSDSNSLHNEWEQINIQLGHLSFTDDAQVRFRVEESNGQDVADDLAIDDFFIGSFLDFTPFYPLDVLNNLISSGVVSMHGNTVFTSGTIVSTSYYPYTTQTFTLVDTIGGKQDGFYIYSPSSMGSYVPEVGDYVVVRGLVDQENGLQVLRADSILLVDEQREVDIENVSLLSEATESNLVSFDDLRVTNIQLVQSWMNVHMYDGTNLITAKIDTATSVDDQLNINVGDEICRLIGVGMQNDTSMPFFQDYYLAPRSALDFIFKPIVDLGNDTIVCDTSKLLIDAGPGFVSYLWNTGDTVQAVPLTKTDSIYIVTVMDQNSCSTSDTIKVLIDVCTSLPEFAMEPGIDVYPNPGKGLFNVGLNGNFDGEIQIKVLDISGKVVLEKFVNASLVQRDLEIDLRDASNGIYFLLLENRSKIFHQKLIVH